MDHQDLIDLLHLGRRPPWRWHGTTILVGQPTHSDPPPSAERREEEKRTDPIRIFAVISWILLPTVMSGGYSLLGLTVSRNPYLTEFREKYFRAGHGHAGVLLVMSLVDYVFLAQTNFSAGLKLTLCIVLLLGILAQSGGFFLHMAIGRDGVRSTGMLVTTMGAVLLAVSTLFLAYGLATANV